MYNSDTRTITIMAVPSDVLAFRVVDKNGNPVYGANVTLCSKGIIPTSFTRVTDLAGIVQFSGYDLTNGQLPPEAIKEIPWLFMANIPNSEYAYWKDEIKFNTGILHLIKLKEYTKVPTFWIKIELRDIIGAELFSNLIADVESAALGWAGMEVVEIKGKGTRVITVSFKPPFHESPVVIEWAAVWFIARVLAVTVAIISIIYVLKWSFGEAFAPVIGGGLLIALLIGALLVAPPAIKKIKEVRGRR
ncbi:hypothetical protein ES703_60440 [subsurface metagenome]